MHRLHWQRRPPTKTGREHSDQILSGGFSSLLSARLLLPLLSLDHRRTFHVKQNCPDQPTQARCRGQQDGSDRV